MSRPVMFRGAVCEAEEAIARLEAELAAAQQAGAAGASAAPGLSLVETDVLVEELQARTDCSIVAFERRQTRASCARFFFSGGFSAALGLASRFVHRLLFMDRESDEDVGSALGEF